MPRKSTQFDVLPNEIVYNIFNFLDAFDILRAFAQLNHRYDDLVRFYIKRIDLTDGWQGASDQLKWISETIETLKIDQRHIFYLTKYQFHQLHLLSLIDVDDWQSIVSRMNLKTLYIWFNEDNRRTKGVIPETVVRFSTNMPLNVDVVRANLVHLSVSVLSVVQVVEIVEHTPNVQHLSVTFIVGFNENFCIENFETSRFETLTSKFHRMANLRHLSFNTIYAEHASYYHRNYSGVNVLFPFGQVETFIDRCCPNQQVLKRVAFKLDQIQLYDNLWPAFERYKNTFDCFEFYVSLITKHKNSNTIKMPSTIDPIGFHVEGIDESNPQGRFLHIYSLPFTFDELNGFTSCTNLNTQFSFSSVRHLYFSQIPHSHPISFQSLAVRMPRLNSINCTVIFNDSNINDSETTFHTDVFYYVYSLHFAMDDSDRCVDYHVILPELLNRMPRLRKLAISDDYLSDAFSHILRPLVSIRLLDLRQSYITSFDDLPRHFPLLSTLLLSTMTADSEHISQVIGTLFLKIPSLGFVSYLIRRRCGQDRVPYGEIAQEALERMKNMDNRLFHIDFHHGGGVAEFSRQIS